MADLAKLVVRLEAESSKLRADLDKSQRKVAFFGKATKKQIFGVSKAFATLSGVVSVAAFGALIKRSLDAGDKIQKLSIRLKASTEALSQYQHVADLTGVSFQTLTLGLQRANRRISEAARGTGEAKDALKELGLDAKVLNRLKPEQQFEAIADAMLGVENQSDKVRLAMKLFDTEGVALLQTMERGSAGIREMRDEADRLGLTITKGMADKMADANDQMTRLNASTKALGTSLAVSFGGTITNIINFISRSVVPTFRLWADEIFGVRRQLNELSNDEVEVKLLQLLDKRAQSLANANDPGRFGEGFAKAASLNVEKLNKEIELLRERKRILEEPPAAVQNNVPGLVIPKEIKTQEELIKALKKKNEAQKKYNDIMNEGRRVFDSTRTPLERLSSEYERLNFLLGEGAINHDTYNRAIVKAQENYDKLIEKSKETDQVTEDLQLTFSSAFEDAIVNGEKFRDVLDGIAKDIARIFIRQSITKPAGNALASFFGGFFADGGRPPTGKVSVVGERGPELFVPDSAGTVIPNHALSGAGNMTINVDARGADAGVDNKIRRAVSEAVKLSYDAVQNDAYRSGPIYKAMKS